jgi:hypothetical protein
MTKTRFTLALAMTLALVLGVATTTPGATGGNLLLAGPMWPAR